jgi:hypothetical protein
MDTGLARVAVARLSLMRRGLKQNLALTCTVVPLSRKTFPDEKGIETLRRYRGKRTRS